MKLLKVQLLPDAGSAKAKALIETPDGETVVCRIIKKSGFRAYLEPPKGFVLTHKQKRILQREAVKAWADQISDTLPGLLESEKVYLGKRMNRLHNQLSVFCPVCDRRTPSEFSETEKGLMRNACYYCGTLRKGKPYISKDDAERITQRRRELTNARKGTGGPDEAASV